MAPEEARKGRAHVLAERDALRAQLFDGLAIERIGEAPLQRSAPIGVTGRESADADGHVAQIEGNAPATDPG